VGIESGLLFLCDGDEEVTSVFSSGVDAMVSPVLCIFVSSVDQWFRIFLNQFPIRVSEGTMTSVP